jgi:hypothetical protein
MDVRVAGAAVSILMWGGYGQERPAAQNGEAPLLRKEAVYPRLESAARFRDRHVGMVVGAAMAHEVGHLLLPKNSHSNIGIMREDLDLKSLRPLGFTAAQSAEIRHALRMWPHRDR